MTSIYRKIYAFPLESNMLTQQKFFFVIKVTLIYTYTHLRIKIENSVIALQSEINKLKNLPLCAPPYCKNVILLLNRWFFFSFSLRIGKYKTKNVLIIDSIDIRIRFVVRMSSTVQVVFETVLGFTHTHTHTLLNCGEQRLV